MKEGLRSALKITGLQFVITNGMKRMQRLYADNWDTQEVLHLVPVIIKKMGSALFLFSLIHFV